MLLAGDEFGNSQQGNNNAYCQDNALAWLHWDQADDALLAFTSGLIRLRRSIPALQRGRWWRDDEDDVRWLNAQGEALTPHEWEQGAHQLQIQLSERWLLLVNATPQVSDFSLPEGEWRVAPPFSAADHLLDGQTWRGQANAVCVLVKQ